MSTSQSPIQDTYVLDEESGTPWIGDTDLFAHAVEHGHCEDPGHVVISADPGTGKSYAALTDLPDLVERFIFVADSKPLADQLGNEHGFPVVHNDAESKPPCGESFITIPHHVPRFASSNVVLVVDEWHSVITHYGFKRKTIDRLIDTFGDFKQLIGLTGTEYVPAKKAKTVEVKKDTDPLDIEPIMYRSLWSAIVSEVERRPNRTHVISLLDTHQLLSGLRDVLEERGYVADAIAEFNSNTTDDEEIAKFRETNVFADSTKVVLTTYTQGLSVKGDHYTAHIAPLPYRKHHPLDIAQFVQRFRDAENFDVKLYTNFSATPPVAATRVEMGKFIGDQKKTACKQIHNYREALAGMDAKATPLSDSEKLTEIQKQIVEDREEYRLREADDRSTDVNLVTRDLGTNQTQMYFNRYQIEQQAAYQSVDRLRRELGEYNIRLLRRKYDNTVLEGSTLEDQRETLQQDDYEEQVENLFQGDADNVSVELVKRALELSRYFNQDNIEKVLTTVGPKTEDWNRLKRKLDIQDPATELEETSKEIYEAFDIGEEYTSPEIKSKMEAISGLPSEFDSKKAATRELKVYFETEDAWPDGNRGHRPVSSNPLDIPIEKPPDARKDDGRVPLPDFLR